MFFVFAWHSWYGYNCSVNPMCANHHGNSSPPHTHTYTDAQIASPPLPGQRCHKEGVWCHHHDNHSDHQPLCRSLLPSLVSREWTQVLEVCSPCVHHVTSCDITWSPHSLQLFLLCAPDSGGTDHSSAIAWFRWQEREISTQCGCGY